LAGVGAEMRQYRPDYDWDEYRDRQAAKAAKLDFVDQLYSVIGIDDPDFFPTVDYLRQMAHHGYDTTTVESMRMARFLAEWERKTGSVWMYEPPETERPNSYGYRRDKFDWPAGTPVVYYIRIRDTIKIGFTTKDPRERCRDLAGDKVLAVEPGSLALEAERHKQFAQWRADIPGTRERFYPGHEINAQIRKARREHRDIQV
jgi:hypothetical protein